MRKTVVVLVFLCVSLAAAQQAQTTAPPTLDGFDEFVNSVRQQWNVPGLGLGIIQNGKVIFAKGYGFRNVEQKLPVTTRTLFPIGSTSKSFTALALAILHDDGKIDWDTPVRQYLPAFQLQDQVATERLTLRDLLTHRTGLARHDLVWYSSNFTRKQMFERLRYLEMSKDLRSTFQYNNLMFMTAGYLAGEVSGLGWEGLVRKRIFDSLDMKASNFSDADSQKSPDYSLPYAEVKGAVKQIPFKPIEEIGPAGGINSNIDEMLHYAQMLLDKGKYAGKQIVSEAGVKQVHSPQMVMGTAPRFAELGYPAYGMGWVIQSYRGHHYVWHNGGIDGFYTLFCLLPNDNLGLVILSNRLGHPAAEIVAYNVFDRLLGLEPVGWNQRFKDEEAKQKKAEEEQAKKASSTSKLGTHPAHDLKEYAGKYENPGYGTVTVTFAGDKLTLALNNISAPLAHYHYEVFTTPEDSETVPQIKVQFNTNMDGEVDGVAIPLQPGVNDIVFKRVTEQSEKKTATAGK